MNVLESSQVSVGMRFSAPVFFEDGKSMFLAQGKPVKPYHIAAISRWNVSKLLTGGHVLKNSEPDQTGHLAEEEEMEELLDEVEELEDVSDE